MDETAAQRFVPLLCQAETIFMQKAERLQKIQTAKGIQAYRTLSKYPYPDKQNLREWLAGLEHALDGKHRKIRLHATAYVQRGKIIYNPHHLEKTCESQLLDLILHELGHMWTWKFVGTCKHNKEWKAVGRAVGFTPIGATSDKRRAGHPYFAIYRNVIAADHGEPFGKVTGVVRTQAGPRVKKVAASTVKSRTGIGPTKMVWIIAGMMWRSNPNVTRKEVIAECVKKGINRNTASTQYSKWKKSVDR